MTEKELQYILTYGHDELVLWCQQEDCREGSDGLVVQKWLTDTTDPSEVFAAVSKHRAEHFGRSLYHLGKAIALSFPDIVENPEKVKADIEDKKMLALVRMRRTGRTWKQIAAELNYEDENAVKSVWRKWLREEA